MLLLPSSEHSQSQMLFCHVLIYTAENERRHKNLESESIFCIIRFAEPSSLVALRILQSHLGNIQGETH